MNKKRFTFISEYIRSIYFLGTVRGDLLLSFFFGNKNIKYVL